VIEINVIRELALERIEELDRGLFIVDIRVTKANKINVEVDSMDGACAINDCISVSRNIEHNLDREVEDFELMVSSPGLDQGFKVVQQYEKNIGRDVKVVLEHGSVEGKLLSINETGVVVETSQKERIDGRKKKELVIRQEDIKFDDIKETKIVISFKK